MMPFNGLHIFELLNMGYLYTVMAMDHMVIFIIMTFYPSVWADQRKPLSIKENNTGCNKK